MTDAVTETRSRIGPGNVLPELIPVDDADLSQLLFPYDFAPKTSEKPCSLPYAIGYMLLCWLADRVLDRRRIYIRP